MEKKVIKLENLVFNCEENELEQITKIVCSTLSDFSYLKLFPNLKTLIINCMDQIEYVLYNELLELNLPSLTPLEELIIINDDQIRLIDVSNLLNIKKLELIGNHNLEILKGVSHLKHLDDVILCDNPKMDIEDGDAFINNIANIDKVLLDVYFYPKINWNHLTDLDNSNIKFCESSGVGGIYVYSKKMVMDMHKKALSILDKFKNNCNSIQDIIYELYKYTVFTLSYDYDNLLIRDNYISNGKKISFYGNSYKSINTAYKAFMKNKVVCEGYANMFKYFLSMLGIVAVTIYVENKDNFTLHAAIKYYYDCKWYYCDPQMENNIEPFKRFNLSKNEFSTMYDLLGRDKKQYECNILELGENNESYIRRINYK